MREGSIRKYKEFQIPCEWMLNTGLIAQQLKLGSMKLAKQYMRRVTTALESSTLSEENDLILRGVRFAFRVHQTTFQFVGGFDAESRRSREALLGPLPHLSSLPLQTPHSLLLPLESKKRKKRLGRSEEEPKKRREKKSVSVCSNATLARMATAKTGALDDDHERRRKRRGGPISFVSHVGDADMDAELNNEEVVLDQNGQGGLEELKENDEKDVEELKEDTKTTYIRSGPVTLDMGP
ncbi:hypothetical protein QJS10_CPB21g01321 [Acorus calamus]|uniref:Uncharacterized protein n=1 Tax=Acorus calamus TaxID=4465 RepID=A0AAV9C485_ACOCL|nr:hypothetical protein QJS10_CPB21g01321 [Acorus calamus]